MPATVSHALSMTTPDNPAYENQPKHWNSAHALTLNLVGSEISGAFDNGGGVTFGLDGGGFITAAAPAGAPSPINFSAGTTSSNIGSVVFSNSNGISFGLNGSTITGTVATNYQSQGAYLTTAMASNRGTDFVQATAAFAGTSASGTINSTGISVSIGPYITTGALSNHSHGNPQLNLTNLSGTTASNSAGFTLSLSANAPGAAAESNAHHLLGANTAGNTTATGSTIGLSGINLTLSGTNGSQIVISGPNQSNLTVSGFLSLSTDGNTMTIGAGPLSFYATGNTTQSSSGTIDGRSITFQGTGGASVGISNGSIVISGATGGAAGDAIRGIAAGGATISTSTVNFSNSNGISFGFGAAGNSTVLTASHNALTTAMLSNAVTLSNIRVSGGTTSNLLSAITFADSNGISFGLNAGTMTATVKTDYQTAGAYLTTAALSNHSHGVTAGNGGFNFQTLSLSNANGISFGTSAGSAITASHNAITTGRASTDAIGLNTAQTNVTWTVNSSGLSFNAGGYAGTTTGFTGANISGSMTHNTVGLALSLSVAAPGAAAENNWHHALGANTAGNTTASGSTIGLSGINLTISGTNASVLNLSVPATSSLSATGQVSIATNGSTISIGVPEAKTYSGLIAHSQGMRVVGNQGQGTFFVQPLFDAPNFQFDRVVMPIHYSNATNSSGSATLSFYIGLYTRNVSTLSLAMSTSYSNALSASGTVGSYSLFSGMRNLMVPWTTTVTANDYWLGIGSVTASAGANKSFSQFLVSDAASTHAGEYGVANNATKQFYLGQGFYSATTAGVPGSIAFTQIQGTGSLNLRPPLAWFVSATI